MKNIFLIALLPAFLFFNTNNKEVIINGELNFNAPVQKVYLSYRTIEGTVNDSSDLINNKFKFKESINEPVLSYITVRFKRKAGQSWPLLKKFLCS